MFIDVRKPMQCAECESRNFETFQDGDERGIRCLSCKHEKRERTPHLTHTPSDGIKWVHQPDTVEKF